MMMTLLCTAHGGDFHCASVKAEARTMQKINRSYKGDPRRVNDLVRASLVFEGAKQMAACIKELAADEDLRLVATDRSKMRLREDFDAQAHSGGYRDVQLTAVLRSAEARSRCVDHHLCEVQLHLQPMMALKSEGGHKTYVLQRNLRGQ